MNRNEFLQRFKLSRLNATNNNDNNISSTTQLKKAAVLIALTEINQQLHVILTKRAEHLKHHPGQISFPGGKIEPQDSSLIATALRESHEEIGLPQQKVEVIGQLKNYYTVSGFSVSPIVAMVDHHPEFIIDKNEVSEVFLVPLVHFIKDDNHYSINLKKNNATHKVHFMPYQHYNIWGATAAMLKDLIEHIR